MAYLIDTHYHLDFLEEHSLRVEVLNKLHEEGIKLVAQTVLPSSYLLLEEFSKNELILPHAKPYLSLGFHPWWIKSQEQTQAELKIFESAIFSTTYIGEVGLDFGQRVLEQANKELQIKTFKALLEIIKNVSLKNPKTSFVVSIHAVKSVSETLDLLEQYNFPNNNMHCILHRFAGTSDELTRLIRMGGYVSLSPVMLRSKRGRAYVKQVPADRLLLETDLPSDIIESGQTETSAEIVDAVKSSITYTLKSISELRQEDMTAVIQSNQDLLYSHS